MNAIYEYIIAGLTVVVILVAAEMNISTLTSSKLTLAETEGYSMAESILDMILLSPGDPPNWGDYSQDPRSFGLAFSNVTEEYTLDAKKVIRLSENSSLYISPGKVRSLLGLSTDCNFVFTIKPVFIIDILSGGDGNFTVNVRNSKGFPMANVNVTGYYVLESLGSGPSTSISQITGIDGKCVLEFDPEPNHVLVVSANLLGVEVMQTYPPNLSFRVEGGQVIKSDVPLITFVNYTTGSAYGLSTDRASRHVKIDGFVYIAEFEIWR